MEIIVKSTSIISEVQTNFERIKKLLIEKEEYRDSDAALIARVWWDDLKEHFPASYNITTAKEMLQIYKDKKLTPAESIRRARQRAQQLCPETRGEKYEDRHKADDEFTQEINKVA